MRMSLNWLRDYVDFDLTPEELEEQLVLSGTAIEAVHHIGTGAEKVYVGQILDIAPHPDADRLTICDVTLGEHTDEIAGSDLLKIVCGAKNMKAGDKVPVALIGAKLPNGMVLESRKIRGIKSQGMLCSEEELGFAEEAQGLMILDPSLELGKTLDGALGLEDTVLELEITPNRPDCMSMIGMAREVAAIAGSDLRVPETGIVEGAEPVTGLADIEVRDSERCPRYMGRIIRGVKIGSSPEWMQKHLAAAGMRPINNVVDITNYVMLETGQPLHAFDYHRLASGKIVVRRAGHGEQIVTLDGVKRALSSEDLVIADGEKPVALAGVMGSEPAEVHQDTVDILLEAAYFRPQNIMATARGIGLITESSARFERGVDPNGVAFACDRAAALMAEFAGGTVSAGAVDLYPEPAEPRVVHLRTQRCRDIIGAQIGDHQVVDFLESLQLSSRLIKDRIVAKSTVDDDGTGGPEPTVEVTVPTFRRDLEREVDLIEEVARLFGYNNVPITMPRHSAAHAGLSPRQEQERDIRSLLMGAGVAELMTNSLVASRDFEALVAHAPEADEGSAARLTTMVALRNPLGEEYAKLRTSLLPGLLSVIRRNANWGCEGLAGFEIGRVFMPPVIQGMSEDEPSASPGPGSDSETTVPRESLRLGIVLWGKASAKEWLGDERAYDFFDLKGILELVWERIVGLDLKPKRITQLLLHPGSGMSVGPLPDLTQPGAGSGKKGSAGWAGELHPSLIGAFDIKGPVFAAEIDLDMILSGEAIGKGYAGMPRFPGVHMDLSLLVDEVTPAGDVLNLITQGGGNLLSEVRLFDLYRGGQVPEGKKSLAYSLLYRSDERTLTDAEAEKAQEKVVRRLTSAGIEVRGA